MHDLTMLDCWYLTGPTASGKTQVGLALAQILGAEIISLDSMAVYRRMDIGTAKPSAEQRAEVPHHMLDMVDPHQEFSVARYKDEAAQCVAEIRSRGRQVLFIGGTPLYLKALIRGLFQGPPADWEFRRQVQAELETAGQAALYERVSQVDPLSAQRLHPNDTRRLIRALEVYKITGQPISHLQMEFDEGRPADQCKVFVLDRATPELNQRIEKRVQWMFDAGLVAETERIASATGFGRTARQAVGYSEVLRHLAGDWTLNETIGQVQVRTRRFAKRQRTWFRSLSECQFVPTAANDAPADIAQQIFAMAHGKTN